MLEDPVAIWPHKSLANPVVDAPALADVIHQKLEKTGAALGLSPTTAWSEANKMAHALSGRACALIDAARTDIARHRQTSPLSLPTARPWLRRRRHGSA